MSNTEVIYETTVGGYNFMLRDGAIEVWDDTNDEYPISFVAVKNSSSLTRKEFDIEVADWYIKNVG